MTLQTVHLVLVQPAGYPHSQAFAELEEALHYGFQTLGLTVSRATNRFEANSTNLILGWHLLAPSQIPAGSILYNLEQLDSVNRSLIARLADLSRVHHLWDYSRRNIESLHAAGVERPICHVPIGTAPGLHRISPAPQQDIDVLFYGSINPRRAAILHSLKASGIAVHSVFGVYGSERDALIARAKVVLNLHYYDSSVLEMVRLSYLWTNRKAVVAECHSDTEIDSDLLDAACFVPYEELVAATRELVSSPDRRQQLESAGQTAMAGRDQAAILRCVLSGDPLHLPAVKTAFAAPPLIRVTVIIPVFNQYSLTRQCLESLATVTPQLLYRVVVIDNASSDETPSYLAGLDQSITVITNKENRGFVDACNQGASGASTPYLLFLNNDTLPVKGWLEALLLMVERDPSIGAAGCRLIYPDGRLQEAGALVFSDGSGWNFGRNGDPFDPQFQTPCEVDYCSGAALMVRRDAFEKLGGFDSRYAPAYYEDTDLCFGLRRLGLKVMYCPDASVVHFEGATAGRNLNQGFKKHQQINRDRFVAKWHDCLTQQDLPPSLTGKPPVTADRRRLNKSAGAVPGLPTQSFSSLSSPAPSGVKTRPHILIIDPLLPCPDCSSGSLRLYQILLILRAMDWEVTLIARNDTGIEAAKREFESIGVTVYATDPEKLRRLGHTTDAVPIDLARILTERPCHIAWLSFYDIAEQYLPDLRRFSPATTVIIDTVDVHFIRESREARLSGNAEGLVRAATTRSRELAIYQQADGVVTVTETDAEALRKAGVQTPLTVIPNIHAPVGKTPNWDDRGGIVFVGNFSHPPNIDAVRFLCAEILPIIKQTLPSMTLTIVGKNPPREVQSLAGPGIRVTGWVAETAPYLDAARVSVAPLRVGAGMKGKIGEALSRGIPVVTTSIGNEGMNLVHGEEILVADDPNEFALSVILLHENRPLWETLSRAGRPAIESQYGISAAWKRLVQLLDRYTPAPARITQPPEPAPNCPLCAKASLELRQKQTGYQAGTQYRIHECSWCDLQFSSPTVVPAALYENIYRSASELPGYARYSRYAEEILREPDPLLWLSLQEHAFWFIRAAIQALPLKPQDQIYEIGCGLGYLTHALRKAGLNARGIDLSQAAVEQASLRFGNHFEATPLEALASGTTCQAAVVILSEVLEHVTDPLQLLRDALRILREDGVILLTTPNKSASPMDAVWDTENPPVHLFWFSETSLRVIAARLDLEVGFFDFSACNQRTLPRLELPYAAPVRPPFLASDGSLLLSEREFGPLPGPAFMGSKTHPLVALQRTGCMGLVLRRRKGAH